MVDVVPQPGRIPLLPEGVHKAGELQAPGAPDFVAARWVKTALLQHQLGEQYVCFTPALLYLYLPLEGRDPYREFCASSGCCEKILFFDLQTPLFDAFPRGINQDRGDPAANLPWQTSLCALPRDVWYRYREFLGRLTVLDRSREELFLVTCSRLTIVDPVFFHKETVLPDRLPLMSIDAVTFWSNAYRCYFRVKTRTPWRPSPAVFEPQSAQEHALLLQALMMEHPNPYAFLEQSVSGLSEQALLYNKAVELYEEAQSGKLSGPYPFYDPEQRRFPRAQS